MNVKEIHVALKRGNKFTNTAGYFFFVPRFMLWDIANNWRLLCHQWRFLNKKVWDDGAIMETAIEWFWKLF